MKDYIFSPFASQGLGISYSSLSQIKSILSHRSLGQAGITIFPNIATGNLVIADHVATANELNGPVQLGYIYNSQGTPAWHFTLPRLKNYKSQESITLVERDGHETIYQWDAVRQCYVAPAENNSRCTLSRYYDQNDQAWVWKKYNPDTGGYEYYSEPNLLLTRYTDATGNITKLYYDQNNELEKIEAPRGNTYHIARVDNTVSIVMESGGQNTTLQQHTFDGQGRLIKTSIGAYEINYSYKVDSTYLDGITQSDGTIVNFYYSEGSQRKIEKIVLGRNQTSGILADDEPDQQNTTRFIYAADHVTIEDTLKQETQITLDANGQIKTVSRPTGVVPGDKTTETTQYQYNSQRQLTQARYPNQGDIVLEYDPLWGKPIYKKGPENQESHFVYDQQTGALVKQINILQQPNFTTEELETYFVYENNFNGIAGQRVLRFVISPQGRVTEYQYDTYGQRKFKRQFTAAYYLPKKKTLPTVLDMQAWAASVLLHNPTAILLTEYAYDQRGQLADEKQYAQVDEKSQGVPASASDLTYARTYFGAWTTRQEKLEDKESILQERQYDALQRQRDALDASNDPAISQNTQTNYADPQQQVTVVLPNQCKTTKTWNTQGVTTSQVSQATVTKGVQERTTTYQNDELGRTIITTHPDKRETYQFFDLQNRPVFSVNNLGAVTQQSYDDINRYQVTIKYSQAIDVAQLKPKFPGMLPEASEVIHLLEGKKDPEHDRYQYTFYNKSHQQRYSVTLADHETYFVTEFQYDSLGRKTGIIHYKAPLTHVEFDRLKQGEALERTPDVTQDRWTSLYYDKDGLEIGSIDPDGWVIETCRDAAGNIKQTIQYATPERSAERSVQFTPPQQLPGRDIHHYYFRNARGEITVEVDAEGYITQHRYYSNGLKKESHRFYTKVDPSWYDDTSQQPSLPLETVNDDIISYTYDGLKRLVDTQVRYGLGFKRQYDKMNALTFKRHYDERFNADLQSITDSDKTRTTQSQYDEWEQVTREANVFIGHELAKIEADQSLTPAQKKEAEQKIWDEQSIHHFYDETGLHTKSTNTLGKTTIFYYDENRRLVVSIDPEGAVIEHFYNNFNEEEKIRRYVKKIDKSQLANLNGGFITPDVRALIVENAADPIDHYGYDQRGNKVSHIDPDSYKSTKQYDAFNELEEEHIPISTTQPSVTIKHIRNTRGKEIETQRISQDHTITVSREFENPLGKMTAYTDELRDTSHYDYDRLGNQTKITDPTDTITHDRTFDANGLVKTDTNACQNTTEYDYDRSQQKKTVEPPVAGTQHSTENNVFAEKVRQTNALGQSETWQHAPNGKVTEFSNALPGDLQCHTQDEFDTQGQKRKHIDPTKIETQLDYNDAGYLTLKTEDPRTTEHDGLNLETSIIPDALGRSVQVTDPRGIVGRNEFNKRSLVTQSTQDYGTETKPGLRLTKQTTYNGQGKRKSTIEGDTKVPNQYEVHFGQDSLGRSTTKTVDPLTLQHRKALALQEENHLDAKGRVVAHIDPKGHPYYLFFDSRGNKRFKVEANGSVMEWRYDAANLKTCQHQYANKLDITTINEHTSLSELKTKTDAMRSELDSKTYYFYDENQRECFSVIVFNNVAENKVDGIVVEKRYDPASRITENIAYNDTMDAANITTLKYDTLVEIMRGKVNLAKDRHTYHVLDEAGQKRFIIDPEHAVTGQVFDKRGRIIKHTKYATPVPNPSQLANTYWQDIAIPMQPAEDRVTYTVFDIFDKPAYIVDGEGYVSKYQHDENGNLVYMCHFADKLTTIPKKYDDLVAVLNELQPNKANGDRITQYIMDNADQIHKIIDADGNEDVFDHDALGNLILHIDRMKNPWNFKYDRAKRQYLKISPEVDVTEITVNSNAQLEPTTTKRQVQEYTIYDKASNPTAVIADHSTDNSTDPRQLTMTYSEINHLASTQIADVEVDDPTKVASFTHPPVKIVSVDTQVVKDGRNLEVCKKGSSGEWQFKVYDSARRLAFLVEANGSVIGYTRNAFGDVIQEIHYEDKLEINLSQYTQTGLPLKTVLDNLILNPTKDRTSLYTRDRRGAIMRVSKDPVWHYLPGDAEPKKASPETSYENNAFGERMIIRKKRFAGHESLDTYKRQYHDRNGNLVAEAEAVQSALVDGSLETTPVEYRVKVYEWDAFEERIKRHEYALPITQKPTAEMTLEQFMALCVASANDRIKVKEFNLLGQVEEERKIGVTRQEISLGSNNVPSMYDIGPLTLTRRYTHTPTGLELTMRNENDDTTYTFYDARGHEIAKANVPFQTRDAEQQTITFIPLTEHRINAHGQQVMSIAYVNGANPINPNELPTPKQPDAEQDKYAYTECDNRGLPRLKQDTEGHVDGMTYTSDRKLARKYWKETTLDPDKVSRTHIDSKHWGFDSRRRPIQMDIKRDGQTQETTQTQYNTFSEDVGEGPGDGTFPHYSRFDQAGHMWNSNRMAGVPTITVPDLTGIPTTQLKAPGTDLKQTEYDDVVTLFRESYQTMQRTILYPDMVNRVLRTVAPPYLGKDTAVIPNVALCVQTSHLYEADGFGKTSLTWPEIPNMSLGFKLTLWQIDSETPVFSAAPRIENGMVGISVDQFPADVYKYEIDFEFTDPTTQQTHTLYKTTGTAQFDSGKYAESKRVVAYIENDTTLWLAGNVTDVNAIELWQGETKINQFTVEQDTQSGRLYVDLSDKTDEQGKFLKSGHYTAKILRGTTPDTHDTLPFTLHTPELSPEGSPLSRTIHCEAELLTLDNHAELKVWELLPPYYSECAVDLECTYIADDDSEETHSDTIFPSTNLGSYTDKDGSVLFCNTNFPKPIKVIKTLTLKLHADPRNLSSEDRIHLYKDQNPLAPMSPGARNIDVTFQCKKHVSQQTLTSVLTNRDQVDGKAEVGENVIVNYQFLPQTVMTITPLLNYNVQEHPQLNYYDVTDAMLSDRRQLEVTDVTSQGIAVNVTKMLPANYPCELPTSEAPKQTLPTTYFSITEGGQVFSSDPATPSPKIKIAAHRDAKFDVWNNKVEETDAEERTTRVAYNDENKPVKTTYPPVDVVESNNTVTPNKVTTRRMGYNKTGQKIGDTDENGHTEAFILNAAGKQDEHILGDGTIAQVNAYDAFLRLTGYWSASQHYWQQVHNRRDKVTSITSPETRVHRYTYDEQQQRTADINPAMQAIRYGYDAKGNITLIVEPQGQATRKTFHRSGKVYEQYYPNSSLKLQWDRDYFGYPSQQTLYDGTAVHFDYNHCQQVVRQYSTGYKSRETAHLEQRTSHFYNSWLGRWVTGDAWIPHRRQMTPSELQSLEFDYQVGLLHQVTDHALNSVSTYEHDKEGRVVERHVTLNNGLTRTMKMQLDAKGRQILAHDTNATLTTEYDGAGNRRHLYATYDTGLGTVTGDLWNTFDDANRILIDQGTLSNHQVVGGLQFTYANNLRHTESQQDIVTTLGYDTEDRLTSTSSSNSTWTSRLYWPAGTVQQYREGTSAYTITHGAYYNSNNWQTSDTQSKPGIMSQSTSIGPFTGAGGPSSRSTTIYHYDEDGTKWYAFVLTNGYHLFDSEKLTSVGGYTYSSENSDHEPVQEAVLLYDVNRQPCTKYGNDNGHQGSGDNYNPETVYFDKTWDGVILRKRHMSEGAGFLSSDTFFNRWDELAFVDPQNNYFATYLQRQDPRQHGSDMHYDFHNMPGKRGGYWGAINAAIGSAFFGNNNLFGKNFMLVDPVHALVDKPRPYTFADYLAFNSGDDPEKGYKYFMPSPMSSFPPMTPESYPVPENDTPLTKVSQAATGSPRYASAIAIANGWSIGHLCKAGDNVKIPQLQLNFDAYIDNVPYQKLIAELIGALSPHLSFKPPKENQSCVEIIVTVIIVVVVAIVAPEIVGALAPAVLAAGGIEAGIAVGVTAALMDAALQGIAVGLGVLSTFSWEQVLEVALSAGIGAGFKLGGENGLLAKFADTHDLTVLFEIMAINGTITVTQQLAELALGMRKELNLAAVVESMVQAAFDLGISTKLPRSAYQGVEGVIERTFQSFADMLIGDAITGTPPNLKNWVAQQIGSEIGSAVGNKAKKEIRSYAKTQAPTYAKQAGPQPGRQYAQSMARGQGESVDENYGLDTQADKDKQDETQYQHGIRSDSNKPTTTDNRYQRWTADQNKPPSGATQVDVDKWEKLAKEDLGEEASYLWKKYGSTILDVGTTAAGFILGDPAQPASPAERRELLIQKYNQQYGHIATFLWAHQGTWWDDAILSGMTHFNHFMADPSISTRVEGINRVGEGALNILATASLVGSEGLAEFLSRGRALPLSTLWTSLVLGGTWVMTGADDIVTGTQEIFSGKEVPLVLPSSVHALADVTSLTHNLITEGPKAIIEAYKAGNPLKLGYQLVKNYMDIDSISGSGLQLVTRSAEPHSLTQQFLATYAGPGYARAYGLGSAAMNVIEAGHGIRDMMSSAHIPETHMPAVPETHLPALNNHLPDITPTSGEYLHWNSYGTPTVNFNGMDLDLSKGFGLPSLDNPSAFFKGPSMNSAFFNNPHYSPTFGNSYP